MDTIFNVTTLTPKGDFIRQSRFFDEASAIRKADDCVAEIDCVAFVTALDATGSRVIHRVESAPRPVVTAEQLFEALPPSDQVKLVLNLINSRLRGLGLGPLTR